MQIVFTQFSDVRNFYIQSSPEILSGFYSIEKRNIYIYIYFLK